jgi:hypothetical protein
MKDFIAIALLFPLLAAAETIVVDADVGAVGTASHFKVGTLAGQKTTVQKFDGVPGKVVAESLTLTTGRNPSRQSLIDVKFVYVKKGEKAFDGLITSAPNTATALSLDDGHGHRREIRITPTFVE